MRKLLLLTLLAASANAATFVVPSDREMVRRADAIVIGAALDSYAQPSAEGGIETVTPFSIEEVVKGFDLHHVINIVEPGGALEGRATIIGGVPHFKAGQRLLLFLQRTGNDRWSVTDLVLGKLRFASDVAGRALLVRDEEDIVGWDSDLRPHREPRRSADAFLAFLRSEAAGAAPAEDYVVPVEPLREPAPRAIQPNATFTATSYTMLISGALGSRWNVFPNGVTFFANSAGEPGAPGNGVTAVQTAIAAWDNDPNSNVNYVYGGLDATHTQGLHKADGVNTVLWEQDLSAWAINPFTCSANGYSGTLGIGGITSTSGQHTLNGETFLTTVEGDVMMNNGLANCTLLFSTGDFNSAVTHEMGHTLGFRHSDQTRDSSASCSGDPTLECSSTAIMKSFITTGLNATLQAWDQHAVDAVYPSAASSVTSAPFGLVARATSSTSVQVLWNPVSGATSYQVFRKAPGGSFVQIATPTTNSYIDNGVAANTAYLYKVRAVNGAGASPDSNIDIATTVIFTDDPLTPGVTVIKAVHLAELRTAVNAVRALAGLAAATFTDAASHGVVVRAVHITELRTNLDQAMSVLGLRTGGYTNAVATGVVIRAVDFQEIRDRVK